MPVENRNLPKDAESIEKSRNEKGQWQINYHSDKQHIEETHKTETEAREMYHNIMKDEHRKRK